MSTVILCNGNYAKTPYYLAADDIRLFSIEEVCFYVYKNAFFLQEDFFCDALVEWIGSELRLPSYADALLVLRGKEDVLLKSIEYLFMTTGYYGEAEVEKVKSIIVEGNSLSVEERRKMRADVYCKKQKYKLALSEYEELVRLATKEDIKFLAKLHHNMGVCHAGMFLYDQAAQEFKKAFDIYPNTESYVQFLAALKLHCPQEEYLAYLSQHPESYQDSLEVESRLQNAELLWENTLKEDRFARIAEEDGISGYEAVRQQLKQIKEEYTSMIGKG